MMHTVADVETPLSRHRHPVHLKTVGIHVGKAKHGAGRSRITTSSGKQRDARMNTHGQELSANICKLAHVHAQNCASNEETIQEK